MMQISIEPIPSQEFSITLDGSFYTIKLTATDEIISCDITRDNVVILSGHRCVPQYPIIPYQYLADGNFMIVTSNDEYPNYTKFNNTQFLIYASAEEIEDLANG